MNGTVPDILLQPGAMPGLQGVFDLVHRLRGGPRVVITGNFRSYVKPVETPAAATA